MRTMEIPPFPQKISFVDLEELYKARLQQDLGARSSTVIRLLGYMAWPNDPVARANGTGMLERWLAGDDQSPDLKLMHQHWAHVADIANLHRALKEGSHQESRGGASIGKAIFLASERIESRGAAQPSLWRHWKDYRDAAHLIAAVITICFDMQTRHRQRPFGLGLQELLPVRVACLFPDLVLGVALTYQKYGLSSQVDGNNGPMLDPETVWRIPPDINVEPMPLPPRELLAEEIATLNSRRAGNRGRANRVETTLISA